MPVILSKRSAPKNPFPKRKAAWMQRGIFKANVRKITFFFRMFVL